MPLTQIIINSLFIFERPNLQTRQYQVTRCCSDFIAAKSRPRSEVCKEVHCVPVYFSVFLRRSPSRQIVERLHHHAR